MKGTAYTYFTTENAKSARDLLAILREAKADVPPQLEEMSMYGGGGGGGRSEFSYVLCLPSSLNYFQAGLAVVVVVEVGVAVSAVVVAAAGSVVATMGTAAGAVAVVATVGRRF